MGPIRTKKNLALFVLFALSILAGLVHADAASAGVSPANCYGCHADLNQSNFPLGTANVVKEFHHKVATTRNIRDCAYCHNVSNPTCTDCHTKPHLNNHGQAATPQPVCASCHASSVVVEHSVNRLINCTACHNNTFATVIYDFDTISGPAVCTNCHTSPAQFGLASFDSHVAYHNTHITIFSECTSCHGNSNIVTVTHKGSCAVCHSSPRTEVTNLITSAIANPSLDVNCASCHGTLAQKHTILSHKDTSGNAKITESATCAGCHSGLNGTLSGIEAVHNTPTNGAGACATCHNSPRADVKNFIANRTAVECTTCHGPGHDITVHTGKITETAGCVDCHTALNGQLTGVEAVHNTPTNGAGACATCHSSTRTDVKNLINARAAVECSSCHTPGHSITAHGTNITAPSECSSCHTDITTLGVLAAMDKIHKRGGSTSCATCHASSSRVIGIINTAVAGATNASVSCAECHAAHLFADIHGITEDAGCIVCHTVLNGQKSGVEAVHNTPTNGAGACATCHSSTKMASVISGFINNNVVDTFTCNTCHAPEHSITAHGTNITAPGECSSCHTDITTLGVLGAMDKIHKRGGSTSCATCHASSSRVIGIINTAVAGTTNASVSCADCHTTHVFADIHGITEDAGCITCHTVLNGQKSGVEAVHNTPTNGAGACATCHSSTKMASVISGFINNNVVDTFTCNTCHAPEHSITAHGTNITVPSECSSCHSDITTLGVLAAMDKIHKRGGSTSCATCHASSSRVIGIINTAVAGATNASVSCTDCHASGHSIGSHGTNITAPAECSGCHSDITTLGVLGAMDKIHKLGGISSCATCHASSSRVIGIINTAVAGTTNASVSCSNCHAAHTIDSHKDSALNAKITAVAGCSACHVALDGGTLAAIGAVHTPANGGTSCTTCHTSTRPAVVAAIAAKQPVDCNTCHSGILDVHAAGHDATIIHPTETLCANCHVANVATEHNNRNRPCTTCHADSTFAGIISSGIAGNTIGCNDCHIPSESLVTHNARHHQKISVLAVCGACHTDAAIVTGIHKNNCAACHASTTRAEVQTVIAEMVADPTKTADCSTCHDQGHGAQDHDKLVIGPMYSCFNPSTQADPAGSCHNYGNFAGVVAAHRNNCATCHSNTGSRYVNAIAAGRAGTEVNCVTCHIGHHSGITNVPQCQACHPFTSEFNSIQDNPLTNLHWTARLNMKCNTCHSSGRTEAVNTIATLKVYEAGSCANCHELVDHDVPAAHDTVTATDRCTACHGAAPTFAEFLAIHDSPTNGDGSCATCHESKRTEIVNLINDVRWQHPTRVVQCSDCHADHDFSQVHSITQTTGCNACHLELDGTLAGVEAVHNVATNGEGACATCHSSPRQDVQAKIAARAAVSCTDCHAAHVFGDIHAITESAGCAGCHTALNGTASGIQAVHDTNTNGAGACATCHGTADAAVRAFIDNNVAETFTCGSCHTQGHNINSHGNNITAPSECAGCHKALTTNGLLGGMDSIHTLGTATSSCATCHAATSRAIGIIKDALASNSTVSCTDCHPGILDAHAAGHDKAILPVGVPICAECHAANVVTEHVTNRNRPCTSCHADSMFAGIIQSGIDGNVVDCLACHGWMIGTTPAAALAKHNAAHHNTISVASQCSSCHGGAVIEGTHKNTCAHCHSSAGTRADVKAVVASMAANPSQAADCLTCHSSGHDFAAVHKISDAGCAQCHTKLTSNPASIETVHNVPTNGAGACATCHNSTRPEVMTAIANRAAITCTACHEPHTVDHDMVVLPSDGCVQCHVANPVTEHVVNHGWGCVACHSSSRPEVQTAITNGSNGAIVNCATCHLGNLNHAAAHDHTFVPSASCKDCHVENVVTEHVDNRGLSCATCHGNAQLQSIIDSGKAGNAVVCTDCHTTTDHSTAHNNTGVPTGDCLNCHDEDVAVEHVTNRNRTCVICHGNPDYAATINLGKGPDGSLVTCEGCHDPVFDHKTAHDQTFLNSGTCSDCHVANVVTEHVDVRLLNCASCHGSTNTAVLATIAAGKAGTAVYCSDCHANAGAHAQQHDQVSLTDNYCSNCHDGNVVIEHVDNRSIACITCHENPLYADTIAAGMSGVPLDCYDCHVGSNHVAAHDNTAVAAPECAACHNGNVAVEHVNNRGLACIVCHGNAAYNNIIAAGRAGTLVVCTDCHGAADHKAAHDMTVVPSVGCSTCHNPNVVVEHVEKRNLACNICHNTTYQAVIDSGAAGNQVTCLACHTMPNHHADSADAKAGNCTACHTMPASLTDAPVQGACRQCHINSSNYVVRPYKTTMAVNHSFNTAGKIQDFGACLICHDPGPYHAKPTQWPGWYEENAKAPGRGSFNIFHSTFKPSRTGEGSPMESRSSYGEGRSPSRTKDSNWRTPKISFSWATVSHNGTTYDVPSFGGTRDGSGGGGTTPPPAVVPTISSLDRTSGSRGTTVTITGINFGSTQGSSYVLFGTTKASIRSWSSTRIQFTVPSVSSGTYKVSVVVNGVASNTIDFRRY